MGGNLTLQRHQRTMRLDSMRFVDGYECGPGVYDQAEAYSPQ